MDISDAISGKLLFSLRDHSNDVESISFSSDNKKIATTSTDNTVKIWEFETGKLLFDLKGHTATTYTGKFSPDAQKLITTSVDNTCKIWNVKTGALDYSFLAIEGSDYLVFDKDGRFDGTEGRVN